MACAASLHLVGVRRVGLIGRRFTGFAAVPLRAAAVPTPFVATCSSTTYLNCQGKVRGRRGEMHRASPAPATVTRTHTTTTALDSARRPQVSCSATSAAEEALQLALRDDYDPIVFLFCANAIFLSVLLNVLNYGIERDEEGVIRIPEGGLKEILRRCSVGVMDYFRKPFQQVLVTDELRAAIVELKETRTNASLMRGTPAAEESALRFMSARKKAIAAGLPEDSPLLSAQSAPEQK